MDRQVSYLKALMEQLCLLDLSAQVKSTFRRYFRMGSFHLVTTS
jgi:hypothetical protein